MGHADVHPVPGLFVKNGLDGAAVKSGRRGLLADRKRGGGNPYDADTRAVFGLLDGIRKGFHGNQPHQGIDPGPEKDLDDIRDGLTFTNLGADELIFRRRCMTETQKPIGPDDHAGKGQASDDSAGKRRHGRSPD